MEPWPPDDVEEAVLPVALFASIQDEMRRALSSCESRLHLDVSEAWEITAMRFVPLHTFLADPAAMSAFEEQFVAAGLFGSELRLRLVLFEASARQSEGAGARTLAAASALLRAVDRVPHLRSAVGPLADLCDLLAATVE